MFEFVYLGVIGIRAGSFLNSVIWRAKSGKSVFRGRSQCIHCDRQLLWRDLVPLLSFILLRGKCRYCKRKISWQYPIVELVTPLIFILIARQAFINFSCGGQSACEATVVLWHFFVASVLIAIFVLDLRYFTVPVSLTLLAVCVSFVANLFLGVPWYNLLLAIGIGVGFFGAQYILSRGVWIGGGDLYIGALAGAVLGFPKVLYAIAIAYFLGGIVAVILLVSRKATWGSKLPLGVFLAMAIAIVLLWGERITKFLSAFAEYRG